MDNITIDFINRLENYKNGEINFKSLFDWVEYHYNKFYETDDFEILSNRLLIDCLLSVRSLGEDLDDILNISQPCNKAISDEIDEVLKILSGEINYYETYIIREDYIKKIPNKYFEIIESSKRLLKDFQLSVKEINEIEKILRVLKLNRKENIIFSELLHTILNLNMALNSASKKLFIGTIGTNDIEYHITNEKEYFINLLKIFNGEAAYRFSIGQKKMNIFYTNIYFIDE